MNPIAQFDDQFAALAGPRPFHWQRRLFQRLVEGSVPAAVDLPTGLGKTSVMAIWLIARAHGADLPRRLVYVVDRRAVVDQATDEAEKLREALEGKTPVAALAGAGQIAAELKKRLGLDERRKLPISTLRGARVDNREWLEDPVAPAIVVGTVDMIGSRLLFEGYGVSRKMRPYHAGLLGVDALVVLDEAHLVPPFAHLLRAVEQEDSLRANSEEDRRLLPRFVFLPLSATQRDTGAGGPLFGLEEEDWKDDVAARKRIEAKKRLRLERLAEKDPDRQLAEAAWALARRDGQFFRVVVFCDRRDKTDEAGGPSVVGVKEAIKKLADVAKKAKRGEAGIPPVEMLVGARRVRDRDEIASRLAKLGFIGGKTQLTEPVFLVATSAGEVGIDIDADHMVCDLVAWERMVQRLGRVNRRGEGDAEITVFWREPSVKKPEAPSEAERRALLGFKSKAVIERLPRIEDACDASPAALRRLAGRAEANLLVAAATTPEPLRPGLDRPLVEAWSMTSLEVHTGRPEVAPWLRGWLEEERPQTTVIWRRYLPIPAGADERTLRRHKAEIEEFFEAAPPHQSEKLETEIYRVTGWLQIQAALLLKHKTPSRAAAGEVEPVALESDAAPIGTERTMVQTAGLQPGPEEIVALVLSPTGRFIECYKLAALEQERKGWLAKEFAKTLAGNILVMDARFGGLSDGLLDAGGNGVPETVDSVNQWSREAGFRIRRESRQDADDEAPGTAPSSDWRFELDLVLRRDEEGNPAQWLRVEHFRDDAQREDARSVSRPQELAEHHEWTRTAALRIGNASGLSGALANALALAAMLHDEGKRAERWQRAFKAARDAAKWKLAGPLAKTRGPIDQAVLGGYRHEFGSLTFVERNAEFAALPEELRDLVLHLVAAHHGQARPVIETRGCEDGPPSMLQERARAVALRFARLQRRWGPWGLAWWEALLRAADHQASRDNDRRPAPERNPS